MTEVNDIMRTGSAADVCEILMGNRGLVKIGETELRGALANAMAKIHRLTELGLKQSETTGTLADAGEALTELTQELAAKVERLEVAVRGGLEKASQVAETTASAIEHGDNRMDVLSQRISDLEADVGRQIREVEDRCNRLEYPTG